MLNRKIRWLRSKWGAVPTSWAPPTPKYPQQGFGKAPSTQHRSKQMSLCV